MRLGRFFLLSIPAVSLLCLSCSSSDESLQPVAEQWSRLSEGDWTLEPGQEDPRWCKKIVLTEDIWLSAMRPIHPVGTHHTTLSLVPNDGNPTCSGSSFGPGLIYAAGVGTGELRMPPGVAMKLPAGQALLLGLHIYNPSAASLSGHSAIEMIRVRPEQVKSEADMLLSGPATLSLPPASRTTISHSCRVATEQNVFNLFPHMHQLGVHIKTTVTVSGEPLVLHDADYQFEEQYQLPVGPLTLRAGDTITTECTYQNDTSQTVTFGESSDTEMCFSILFRYPRGKSPFCAGDTEGGGTGGGGDGGTPIAKKPCAEESEAGNAVGVGEFCSPGGGQCAGNMGADLCLGDFVKDEEFANFCTKICTSDGECGEGAFCGHDSTRICIPSKCLIDGGS
jgi:Copper type II ascorbate-dependent monooxygenase, C-terminal domain